MGVKQSCLTTAVEVDAFKADKNDLAYQRRIQGIGKSVQEMKSLKIRTVPEYYEGFKIYFKGLLISDHETVRRSLGGIGVAICDQNDHYVTEVCKPVMIRVEVSNPVRIDGEMRYIAVELKALIEGLNKAVELGLKRVHIFCDNKLVYQYLIGEVRPTNSTIVRLLDEFNVFLKKFSYCVPYLISQNNVKFAYNIAREAIASHTTRYAETSSQKALLDQCKICFESAYIIQMISVNGCLHRYCFLCMRKHVEAKLLQGQLPECPHEKYRTRLNIESCNLFLTPKLYELMMLRIREAAIPPAEKVYCPYSNCSALMSKTELQVYTSSSSTAAQGNEMRKCVKCQRSFCINCQVDWHNNMTCNGYMKHSQTVNEEKFKLLATKNRWRQCTECKHMVELTVGCNHISCRCGHYFCYTCGADLEKQICGCRTWDEKNLIYTPQIPS